MGAPAAEQLSLPDLDGAAEISLRETTFVVVDLETTGGRMTAVDGKVADAITEIGAVKVRGGVVLGEFATLVDPQRSIPPQIVQLTGITTAMVCDAPTIAAVLPMFLEFARGAVLVAHNARFDMGFLRAAADQCGIRWSRPQTLCTVQLARRVLSREEAPSVRLAALARLFAVASEPTHRALDDARATVEVLHALIERVGNQGVHTYAELRSYLPDVSPAQRRKRVLAEGLPRRPGVYLFRGPANEVLYVGTAINLRRRVSQYFNGSDQRTRIKEMVTLAGSVEHVECAHALEAGVRELRMLAAHAPPYNRRSKFPHRWWWVVLSDEAFPRFSVVRTPRHDRAVGPFRSRADAADTADLLARLTGVRSCTKRLARTALHGPACPQHEVSPCPAGRDVTAAQYAPAAGRAAALIDGLDNAALAEAVRRIAELAGRQRYESAARLRDHTVTAVEVLWRGQRLRALTAVAELVAAAPDGEGGWQLAVIRHGQLAAAGMARRGVPPMPVDRRDPGRCASGAAAARAAGRRAGRRDRAGRTLADGPGGTHRVHDRRRGLVHQIAVRGAVGRVGRVGALRAGGRRAGRHEPRLRAADRTAPIARAAVRPLRCRSRRRPGPARPPTPAATRRGWIARHGPRSRPRR